MKNCVNKFWLILMGKYFKVPPSFPISQDRPSHHQMVYSSVYPIASTDELEIQAVLERLATTVNRYFRRLPKIRLEENRMIWITDNGPNRSRLRQSLGHTNQLTVMLNVFIKHFNSQNSADFSKSLQMIDVNDVRSQCIIQNRTNAFQIWSKYKIVMI